MNPSTQSPPENRSTPQAPETLFPSKNSMLDTLALWINHKQKLMETENYATNMGYMKHLGIVTGIKHWAMKDALTLTPTTVYRFILMNRDHLQGVLPHPANKSRESQEQILNNILTWCEHEIR